MIGDEQPDPHCERIARELLFDLEHTERIGWRLRQNASCPGPRTSRNNIRSRESRIKRSRSRRTMDRAHQDARRSSATPRPFPRAAAPAPSASVRNSPPHSRSPRSASRAGAHVADAVQHAGFVQPHTMPKRNRPCASARSSAAAPPLIRRDTPRSLSARSFARAVSGQRFVRQ